jgi:hypothetical protein
MGLFKNDRQYPGVLQGIVSIAVWDSLHNNGDQICGGASKKARAMWHRAFSISVVQG